MEWPEMIFIAVLILLFLLWGKKSAAANYLKVYPELLKVRESVSKWAARYSVPPDVVAAVIMQESGGQIPTPPGSAGELGPMQVKDIAYRETVNRGLTPEGLNRSNIDNNIRIGTAYLSLMIDLAGNLEDGLRYYNAGPTGAANGGGRIYAQQVLQKINRIENE